jgi:hypothetical protein
MEDLGNKALRTNNRLNVLQSVHIAVMCVIKISRKKGTCRFICVYILGSVHIAVMCVNKHSNDQAT